MQWFGPIALLYNPETAGGLSYTHRTRWAARSVPSLQRRCRHDVAVPRRPDRRRPPAQRSALNRRSVSRQQRPTAAALALAGTILADDD
jgi:hypothetical protein